MPFAEDTFTDTAGTVLESHTASDGGSWTKSSSLSTGSAAITDANRVRSDAVPSTCYYHSGSPAGVEYNVEADLVLKSDNDFSSGGVCGRIDTGADTLYFFRQSTASNLLQLGKRVAGASTTIATSASTPTPDVAYRLKLEILDATKKGYVDGVEVVSTTDNAITAAGKAGIWVGSTTTNTEGVHLDNFAASDPGGGGGDPEGRLVGGKLVGGGLLMRGVLVG